MGLLAFPTENRLVSISDDGRLCLTDIASGTLIEKITPLESCVFPLKVLRHVRNSIFAFCDGNSSIFIYDFNPSLTCLFHQKLENCEEIRGLDVLHNTIIAGQLSGTVNIWECTAGREKLTKKSATFQAKNGIREICIRQTPRREVIIADNTGVVNIHCLTTLQPVMVLQAHTDVITSMHWFEGEQILMTGAKDKSVKFWRFPPVWIDDGDLKSHVPPPISVKKDESLAEKKAEPV